MQIKEGHQTRRNLFFIGLLLAGLSFASLLNADPLPAVILNAPNNKSSNVIATLQLKLHTIFFDRDREVLSAILAEIPKHFPQLKLNTLGRGLHSSICYLEGLTELDARTLIAALHSLPRATLEKFDLLKPVKVFDFEHIDLKVVGTKSKFLALTPHSEFVEWQMRFYNLLQEVAPDILKKHLSHRNLGLKALSKDAIHFSLVQWGDQFGISLSEAEVEELKIKMNSLIQTSVKNIRERGGSLNVYFSLEEEPLQFVLPPHSFAAEALAVATFAYNRDRQTLEASPIVRWVWDFKTGAETSIYERPLASILQLSDSSSAPLSASRLVEFDALSKSIPPRLSQILNQTTARGLVSPSQRPEEFDVMEAVENPSPATSPPIYVSNLHHPLLQPQKAFKIFDATEVLEVPDHENIFTGLSVYASSVRREFGNPSDYDMLMNVLIDVPDTASTYEQARAYAVHAFAEKVFGAFVQKDRERKIAFTELRIGSEYTMTNGQTPNVLAAYESNPTYSEQDILSGQYRDSRGRVWSIEELINLGDWIKAKIDIFKDGLRQEISLQWIIGFHWKGTTQILQSNGYKGIAPLLRTGVYKSRKSYAIACILHKFYLYYSAQKGPLVAKAIRELRRSAHSYEDQQKPSFKWSAKLLKRFYNLILLLESSDLKMAEVLWEEMKAVVQASNSSFTLFSDAGGKSTHFAIPSLDRIKLAATRAINPPEFGLINAVKRVVNDLREYYERKQELRDDQWKTRVAELVSSLARLKSDLLLNHRFRFNSSFQAEFFLSLGRFEGLMKYAFQLPLHSEAQVYFNRADGFEVIHQFEKDLVRLEEQLIIGTTSESALDSNEAHAISVFTDLIPILYFQYRNQRTQDGFAARGWLLRLMGIEPTTEHFELIRRLVSNLKNLGLDQIVSETHQLFVAPANICVETLSQIGSSNLSEPSSSLKIDEMETELD